MPGGTLPGNGVFLRAADDGKIMKIRMKTGHGFKLETISQFLRSSHTMKNRKMPMRTCLKVSQHHAHKGCQAGASPHKNDIFILGDIVHGEKTRNFWAQKKARADFKIPQARGES